LNVFVSMILLINYDVMALFFVPKLNEYIVWSIQHTVETATFCAERI